VLGIPSGNQLGYPPTMASPPSPMKHVPLPSWDFEELVRHCWTAYIGRGVESTGRRLNIMRTWGAMVGRERAVFELDRFVKAEGGWDRAAETAGAAKSSLKSLRNEFLRVGAGISPRAPTLKLGEELRGESTRYMVSRRIGEGGMGQVYEAISSVTQERFAIKLLSTERFAITSSVRARFRREAAVASQFSHANLVRAIELIQHGPDLVIVMELLPGPRLLDELRKARPAPAVGARWMMQLASGLAYLHEREIIHRDIAPKNALFRRYPETLSLCDFGVARNATDVTLTTSAEHFGSLLYISPQQKADPHTVTEADDVFSLGQVFAYITTGEEPHAAGIASPGVDEGELLPELTSLIARMRSSRRIDRPRDARAVVHELEPILRALKLSLDSSELSAAPTET
jgi:serine/threonine protein kinase